MEEDLLFRAIAVPIFLSGVAIGIYHRRKAAASGETISRRQEGTPIMVLLRLFGFSLWLAILAYLINPAWMEWSSLDLPTWLRWIGVALGVLMVVLLYWVFHTLGRNVTDTVVTRREHTLVTGGPYNWVRHPLYSTSIVSFVGFGLLSANWFVLAMGIPTFLMLTIRTPIEEAKLVERFGDEYRAYMERTGRFLPRLFSGRA